MTPCILDLLPVLVWYRLGILVFATWFGLVSPGYPGICYLVWFGIFWISWYQLPGLVWNLLGILVSATWFSLESPGYSGISYLVWFGISWVSWCLLPGLGWNLLGILVSGISASSLITLPSRTSLM